MKKQCFILILSLIIARSLALAAPNSIMYNFSSNAKRISVVRPVDLRNANSFSSILQKIDVTILKGTDSIQMEINLKPFALEIINYVKSVYKEDISGIGVHQIILTAAILAPFEFRDGNGSGVVQAKMQPGDVFSCLMGGIGAVGGIGALANDIASMWNSGATVSSVFGVVKRIFKQYFGWFGVVWAVIEFGDCMNWW